MSRKRYLFLLFTISTLFLAACQTAVNTVDSERITGVYTLVKVDGATIPGTVSHDGVDLQVSSGTFTINANGTIRSSTVFIPPGGQGMTREVRAKYSVEGSRLIMKWKGAGTTEGTVEGDTFVMDNHGMIFEYTRNPSRFNP